MKPVIEINNLNLSYGQNLVLDNVSLKVDAEEFIGVIGPNAAGKTTLMKIILGLIHADSGSVSVLGKNPGEVRSQIGYVSQKPEVNHNFPITVKDAVLLGRMGVSHSFGAFAKQDKKITEEILSVLEIDNIAKKQINELSGGQLQRVWIARALVCQPEILILDEPTANIDLITEEDIFALLKKYNTHMTILVVSHDIAFISSYVDRVACINKKLVCHDVESINGKTIEELYGIDVNMIHHSH